MQTSGRGFRARGGSFLLLFGSALHSFKISMELITEGVSYFCLPGVTSLSPFFFEEPCPSPFSVYLILERLPEPLIVA